MKATCSGSILFNKISDGVDRTSTVKQYRTDLFGYPLNPKGRTGIRGRGCLPRYGPNHQIIAIFTRGKMPIEYLASVDYQNHSMAYLGMLTELVDDPSGHKAPPKLLKKFRKILLKSYSQAAVEDIIQAAFATCLTVRSAPPARELNLRFGHYKGFMVDERNTDNAWVESTIYEFIDRKVTNFGLVEMNSSNNELQLNWIELEKDVMTVRLRKVTSRTEKHFRERIRNSFLRFLSTFKKKSTKDKAKTVSAVFAILITVIATVSSVVSLG
ncbi:nudix hydrolase 6 [Trichuris trichiura]|uniref:Nudix hydrolase 6 n=1 Tax=Trichuris trichiura TaxID=36087 RepID=A0A077Z0U7_TRITR|nr:nudix hydrolase 6 [Trichuris trichiura]